MREPHTEDGEFLDAEPAPYPGPDETREDVFVRYIMELLEERVAAQEPYRTEWTQNLLFLAGLQWWEYNRLSGHFELPHLPKWRERPVHNRLKPFAKTFMAKILKNRPVMGCVPHSDDTADAYAVDLGNDVLRAKWIELNFDRKMRQVVAWITGTGNSYVLPFWNNDSGIMMPLTAPAIADKFNADTGELVGREVVECPCGEDGKPIMTKEGNLDLEADPHFIDIGEIGVKTFGPFNVFPNEDAVDDDDVDSFIVAEAVPIREIRRRWPNVTGIMPEDTSEIDDYNRLLATGVAAGADTHYSGPQFEKPDGNPRKALVVHYYEKPNTDFGKGRYCVISCNRLLQQPRQLPGGLWPPLIHIKDLEVAGQYLGEATITAAIGDQREINKYSARISEHMKLLTHGKILVPKGARIRKNAFNTRPGEVIQHTPGLEPKQMEFKPLPSQVWGEREFLENSFQKTTSMHGVSQGEQPEGVTAGRAFLVLEEADDNDLIPITLEFENMVARMSWYVLRLIQQYYDEERTIRISGENKSYRVRAFKGADLQNIVDVEPQRGSAFPWSKTAKQAQTMELLQLAPWMFMDPETGLPDRQRFREAFEIGGEKAVGSGFEVDVARARREEDLFLGWDGMEESMESLPKVQVFHDHAVHMRQHRKTMNSAEFDDWPPECKLALIEHWFAHRNVLMAEMQQEMMMAAAGAEGPDSGSDSGGGGGGGSGGGSASRFPGLSPDQGASLHRSEVLGAKNGQSSNGARTVPGG